MSKAEEKPVSEYGEPFFEPWEEDEGGDVVDCLDGFVAEFLSESLKQRAIACTNALAGIPNPEAVREVLKEARFVRAALKLGDLCASDLKRLDEAFESLSAPSTGAQQKGA